MSKYTKKQWAKDKTFQANILDEIDEDIYFHFLESIPPVRQQKAGFLCGEPASVDNKTGQHLYEWFQQENNKYFFYGLITLKEYDELIK